jgi:hypothetical protein
MTNTGIRFLSSMRFAFWSIVVLIAWFLLGAILYKTDAFAGTFHSMNDQMILDWLMQYARADEFVLIWFIGLCICALAVSLSFAFCSATTLLKNVLKLKNKLSSSLLFVMHFMFILIVLFHALSMVVGFKYGYRKAFSGETIVFPGDYRLLVDSVYFVNDPAVLKDKKSYSKIRMTKENFSIGENSIDVSLYKGDKLIGHGQSYFLKPMVVNDIRITIEKFFLAENGRASEVGVVLCLSRNPLLWPFFIVYGLSVLLLAVYAFIFLKKTD